MQVSYQFVHNEINLSTCKNFIPQKITSSYPITNLLYIINTDDELQKFDLILLNKIFKITTEDDFGEYEYDLKPLNIQPFMCRELSRIVIQLGSSNSVVTNATMHGILADDDDNDFMMEIYDTKSYTINNTQTVCRSIISNVFYIIYESSANERNLDTLVYNGSILTDFTYERVNNTCYKIEVALSECDLYITSLIDQTIKVVYKIEHTLTYDGSNNIIGTCAQNARKKITFKTRAEKPVIDQNVENNINVTLPPDMRIKITKFVSSKLEEDKLTCPLTQDDIEENERYYKCAQCKNAFGFVTMSSWLKINKKCPLCRLRWPDSDILYINTNVTFVHVVVQSTLSNQVKIIQNEREERRRLEREERRRVIANINNVYTNYINELNDEHEL